MSDPKDQNKTTGEKLAAVESELHEASGIVVGLARLAEAEQKAKAEQRQHTGHTPPPVTESTEGMRVIAERVFDDKIPKHKLSCMEPGGGLYEVRAELKGIRLTLAKGAAIVSVLTIAAPIALAIWNGYKSNENNRKADERLQHQIDMAADVARTLKAVQDASKIHGALESAPPACQFAQVVP